MKVLLKISLPLTSCLLLLLIQPILAQPSNDECINAIDLSEAFAGNCGDITYNGPFDLTGSTPGADDPPVPGALNVCVTDEVFGDVAGIWENSVWFKWTIPDINGEGPNVSYSFWTSDGSFADNCGINPNNILAGDADTQIAIYRGADCPTTAFDPCDHFAANEDLFNVPPWISGWLNLEFDVGEIYYMAVDGWDGVEGEFCITVGICGVECGDQRCDPVETYCDCEDCRTECLLSVVIGIDVQAGGNFPDPDFEGNLFICSERVLGYSNGNVYLAIAASEDETCDGTAIDLPIELSVGNILGSDEDGLDTLMQGFFNYVELTPEDIAVGSITITSNFEDGLGSICTSSLTLNFDDYPQATDPYCNITCFAGGIDTILLNNGITVCENEPFTLNTDGMEDLTLPCDSDDGSSYVYAWRVYADIYEMDEYAAVTSWLPLGPNPTIDPTTFFIDEFGYTMPYYTPGYPLAFFNSYTGEPTKIRIRGAAICFNADGSLADGCSARNEGYDRSQIDVLYLPADDPLCTEEECIVGQPCTHQSGNVGTYGNNCKCYIPTQDGNDECVDAIDISYAFEGACRDFTYNGPFTLTGSTPGTNDPPEPGEAGVCPNEEDSNLFGDNSETWENSVWFTFIVPDLNGDGSPVAYSIWTSDGSFNDNCGINFDQVLLGEADTQAAIYEGACPTSTTEECDHFAANEDLFDTPPWISGWLTLEFTPSTPYYMAVDGWDSAMGDFCITVVPCGIQCGDDECAPLETYCDCADCRNECMFSSVRGVNITENGNFWSHDFEGNIFVCAEWAVGYSNENVYLTISAAEDKTCDGTAINLPLNLSVGNLLGTDEDGLDTLTQGVFTFIELTPEDIATGSITITSNFDDGLGNNCTSSLTLNFADYPQATAPYCELECFAGGIETNLLDNGITVCEDEPFTLSTDGLEDLTLPCNSDDGSYYVYAWRVLANIYGTGDFAVVNSWQPLGTNPTIDPATFFVDEFDGLLPHFPRDSLSFFETVYGEPLEIRIEGAAICFNADGSIVDGCLAANEGYESSQIEVRYLLANDPLCSDNTGSNCAPPTVGSFDCEE